MLSDAMRIIQQAWASVKQSTISNCFAHCHFKVTETPQPEPATEDPEDDLPLAVLVTRLRSVGFEVNGTVTDFVTADDQLATSEAITDDIILNTVKNPGTDHHVCAESDDEDDDPPPKPPSHGEAVDMCAKLSVYLESLPDTHQYDCH